MVLANPPLPSLNPPDSIDEMLDAGRMESGDDSPTSRESKQGRDEGDIVDDDTPLKRCRSSKDQRIGSGYGIGPEDLA